jgi:hypothetical protein
MTTLTLLDLGLVVLCAAFVVRIVMIGIPALQFARMFKGKVVEGTKLYSSLEIPGFNQFMKQEIYLGFIPYIALTIAILLQGMGEVRIDDMSLIAKIATGLGLTVWLIFDGGRSYTMNRQLEFLRNDTENLRTIAGSALEGLRYVVYLRGTVRRTALQLGKRAAVGLARKKLEERDEEKGKTSLARVAMLAVDRLVSFPERVIGRLADWAKEVLDERFAERFKEYSERTRAAFFFLIVWSLFPSIWLSLIVQLYN